MPKKINEYNEPLAKVSFGHSRGSNQESSSSINQGVIDSRLRGNDGNNLQVKNYARGGGVRPADNEYK